MHLEKFLRSLVAALLAGLAGSISAQSLPKANAPASPTVEVRAQIVDATVDAENGVFLLTFDKGRSDGFASGQTFVLKHRKFALTYDAGRLAKADEHTSTANVKIKDKSDAPALTSAYEAIFQVPTSAAPQAVTPLPAPVPPVSQPPVTQAAPESALIEELMAELTAAIGEVRWDKMEAALRAMVERPTVAAALNQQQMELLQAARERVMSYLALRNELRAAQSPAQAPVGRIADLPALALSARDLVATPAARPRLGAWAEAFARLGASAEATTLREAQAEVLAQTWRERHRGAARTENRGQLENALAELAQLPPAAFARLDRALVEELRTRLADWQQADASAASAEESAAAWEGVARMREKLGLAAAAAEARRRATELTKRDQLARAEARLVEELSSLERSMQRQLAGGKKYSPEGAREWNNRFDEIARKNGATLGISSQARQLLEGLRNRVAQNTATARKASTPW